MVTVNAMGDNCPIPVIKTKKAMQALTGRSEEHTSELQSRSDN